jgi:phosphate transport system substrate-binding protein
VEEYQNDRNRDRDRNSNGNSVTHPLPKTLPKRNIDVQGGGSTAGIQAIENGIADIGMCSRSLKSEEAAVDTPVEIARDGLAIVVHKSNPVDNLTLEQVRLLFSGQVENWKELGGSDTPVRLIMREEGSGTREAFVKLVMGKNLVSRKALVQESNGSVKELVRLDPAAVGYMSLGLVGTELKTLDVDGIKPSAEHVRSGQYKLSRPFLFVLRTGRQLRPEAQEFIDFVLSDKGQNILESEGLVRAR